MKIIVFAGGVGTRLWPLSRKNSPKQFGKIIGDKSTLQQTVHRLVTTFKPTDIYIATGKRYEKIIKEQLPEIPQENFIFEPAMRDVGPAIGLASFLLAKQFPQESIAILWSDHLVKNVEAFHKALRFAEEIVKNDKGDFVFIAQTPRFPNQNMGWIEKGEEIETKGNMKLYSFKSFKYRPTLDEAINFYNNKQFVWNLGYFVTTPAFLTDAYKRFAPEMSQALSILESAWGTTEYEKKLSEIYPTLEKISFDDLILEKLNPNNIFLISEDLGWSDVGAWESLKEALEDKKEDNITKGNVYLQDTKDSLVFNFTKQLVVGIGLEDMLVVTIDDVVLVCPKKSVPKVKKFVESLEGTPHEHLI